MRIAIQTRCLRSGFINERGYFIYEIFSRIARNHPEHEFFLLTPGPVDHDFLLPPGIKVIISGPNNPNTLSERYWWNIRLPLLLTKNKVDIFFGGDGFYCPRSKIPQCILSDDLHWIKYPGEYSSFELFAIRRRVRASLKKVNHIFFANASLENLAKEQFNLPPGKLSVVLPGNDFSIIVPANKELVREKYTGGRHFYLTRFVQASERLIDLLKSFSAFKKRQQTNMNLVIFIPGSISESFRKLMSNYKYRDDVKLVTGKETFFLELLGSAYGYIDTGKAESPPVFLLMAAKSGIPLILAGLRSQFEIFRDSALYPSENDPGSFAAPMMMLYKNEVLRSGQVGKAKTIADEFSWDLAASTTWSKIASLKIS